MAAIPTYIYIGDKQLNGQTTSSMSSDTGIGIPIGEAWSLRAAIPQLMQQVPSQASGAPQVGQASYFPWWDGQYTSGGVTGNWVVYHHISSYDYGPLAPFPGTNGDNWYAVDYNQSPPLPTAPTFGPTISLMQFLKSYHGITSPGFKFLKVARSKGVVGDGTSGWAPSNSSSHWADFRTNVYDVAVSRLVGDTLNVRGIFIDASTQDLIDGATSANYDTKLRELITKIRDTLGNGGLGSSAPIWLISHDPRFRQTARPGVAGSFREVHANIAANSTNNPTFNNIRVIDMTGANLAPADVTTADRQAANPEMYASDEYIALGYRMGVAIESYYKVAPSVVPGSGIATYFLLGDSQAKGTISPLVATFGDQATILGAYNAGTPNFTRSYQYIWNGNTNLIEPYSVLTNSNTLPSSEYTTGVFGPEATMMKRLAEEHGQNGFLVIKIAKNGAALTTEAVTSGASDSYQKGGALNNLYDKLVDAWNRCKRDMVTERPGWETPRVPDVRGIAIVLGDNDTYSTEASTAFANKIGTFITNMVTDFRTRTDTTVVPVVMHHAPKGVLEGGQSTLGNQEARTAVRAAQTAVVASRSTYVSLVNTDDLELKRSDNIHYGGEANYELGYRLADALLSLSATGAAGTTGTDTGEDTGEDGPPPEGATLVVEDGTGLASANSYISLADANTYFEARRNPATWTEADDAAREQALRVGTDYLDAKYGDMWVGIRNTKTQALDWPRALAYDLDGYPIETDEVPKRLKHATAEMALRYLTAPDELLPDVAQDDQSIASESNTVGPISQSISYQGGKAYSKRFTTVERLLKTGGLIESDSWANR